MTSDSEDEVEYELEEFVIGPYNISITTVAYLPITKLLANQSKNVEISGQKLWCGSLCIINHLLSNASIANGAVFIELGAGTGVVTMITKKLGARLSIATDHDQISLDHMKSDFPLNQIDGVVERLDWYEPDLSLISKEIEKVDNNSPIYLVAGDVLYKHALLAPFFNTVTAILAKYPQATLILCHVPRAGVEQCEVVDAAENVGLNVQPVLGWELDQQLAVYCPEEDLVRARIYSISKP